MAAGMLSIGEGNFDELRFLMQLDFERIGCGHLSITEVISNAWRVIMNC